jgi:hypothetical protein
MQSFAVPSPQLLLLQFTFGSRDGLVGTATGDALDDIFLQLTFNISYRTNTPKWRGCREIANFTIPKTLKGKEVKLSLCLSN